MLNTRDIRNAQFERQLEHQAFHDPVTNLPTAPFRDRVLHAIERQERDAKPIAVLFMDTTTSDIKTRWGTPRETGFCSRSATG